jgi:acetyl-CoA C-acetyltransferase
MPSSVILGTARTPFGKMGGALSSLGATDLGGQVIEAALERSGVDPGQVQQIVFGQVLQAGQGQIPSRQAQIKGGVPKEVPSETVNKVCASGMRTLGIADMAIRAGDTEVAVTGGMESMSQAPYLLPGARFGFRMGDVTAIDAMTHDGLTNPFTEKQMINEASEVSNELEITRLDMDRFAERSHRLAAEATDAGRLADEIVGVTVKSRKGETTVEADEAIRPDTTLETLAKLRAIGGDDATHTAGNAPGVNDGAGAIVVASSDWAEREGRTPLARVLSYGMVADDFAYLAKTPANAAKQALEKIGKSPEEVEGQRQRRRDRPRPPDRRLRRPHRRRARA